MVMGAAEYTPPPAEAIEEVAAVEEDEETALLAVTVTPMSVTLKAVSTCKPPPRDTRAEVVEAPSLLAVLFCMTTLRRAIALPAEYTLIPPP
jgi:hypothetical protein